MNTTKGFTLIELIVCIAIIGLIAMITTATIGSTLSLSKEKSYEILKTNIISSVETYLLECENSSIDCTNDYTWSVHTNKKTTNFYVGVLMKYKYFNTDFLINPINNQSLDNCLIVNVEKDKNYNQTIILDDSLCFEE